jgi:hypothetical protein
VMLVDGWLRPRLYRELFLDQSMRLVSMSDCHRATPRADANGLADGSNPALLRFGHPAGVWAE